MKLLKLVPNLLLFLGFFFSTNFAYAEIKNPKNYKVLSSTNKKLSIANIESMKSAVNKLEILAQQRLSLLQQN